MFRAVFTVSLLAAGDEFITFRCEADVPFVPSPGHQFDFSPPGANGNRVAFEAIEAVWQVRDRVFAVLLDPPDVTHGRDPAALAEWVAALGFAPVPA